MGTEQFSVQRSSPGSLSLIKISIMMYEFVTSGFVFFFVLISLLCLNDGSTKAGTVSVCHYPRAGECWVTVE